MQRRRVKRLVKEKVNKELMSTASTASKLRNYPAISLGIFWHRIRRPPTLDNIHLEFLPKTIHALFNSLNITLQSFSTSTVTMQSGISGSYLPSPPTPLQTRSLHPHSIRRTSRGLQNPRLLTLPTRSHLHNNERDPRPARGSPVQSLLRRRPCSVNPPPPPQCCTLHHSPTFSLFGHRTLRRNNLRSRLRSRPSEDAIRLYTSHARS